MHERVPWRGASWRKFSRWSLALGSTCVKVNMLDAVLEGCNFQRGNNSKRLLNRHTLKDQRTMNVSTASA
eukprot:2173142-Amphidinium_carterae.1